MQTTLSLSLLSLIPSLAMAVSISGVSNSGVPSVQSPNRLQTPTNAVAVPAFRPQVDHRWEVVEGSTVCIEYDAESGGQLMFSVVQPHYCATVSEREDTRGAEVEFSINDHK